MARVALGDQPAFAELYAQTSAHLYGVAVRILRDGALAEEILQEAFVSVWHHAGPTRRPKASPRRGLPPSSATGAWISLRRREIDTITMTADDDDGREFDLPSGDPTPVEMLLAGADAQAVRDCVDALDAGPKQAIALAFYQGLSHAELSDHLRQPLGTVKSWVRRALERLKGCLDRVGYTRT